MTDEVTTDRRTVLKIAGGIAACSTLGSFATGSAAASHNDDGTAVRVNQVGYPKDSHKIANVTSEFVDVSSVSSFEVQDANTGESVYSGSLSSAMKDDSPGSGHTVKRADFSDVTTAGEYRVVVGDHESHPFTIGSSNDVYGDLLVDVGRLYTLKRANADIDDPMTGLDIGPGHMNDKNAIIAEPRTSDFLKEHSAGDTIDVTGGWYDAGDYGKYVITHGVTIGQLLLAYERNPEAFSEGQYNFPSSLDDPDIAMPDVLTEVKYGIEFLTKMQRSDGALFYKLSGKHWPGMDVLPTEDDQKRYVFGLSSAGTAMAVGAFAMAARVYRDHDPEYADRMLNQAEKGFQWLRDHPNVVWEKSVDQDSGSGAYGRSSNDAADRYWAAAELLRTTGDSTYDDYIQNDLPKYEKYDGTMVALPAKVRSPIDWTDPISLGHYAYVKADGQASDVARTALVKAVYITQRYQTGYPDIHNDAYTTGLYSYYWGCIKSGVSRTTQTMWGVEMSNKSWISKDSVYWKWAMEPVHHVLGRSATGYSYVTEYGELSTQNPHDRIVVSTGVLIPGMLVGGPHNNVFAPSLESDTTSEHVTRSTHPALSYYDDYGSYATNEWAINYTAPLFLALADVPGMKAEGSPDPDPDPDPSESEISIELSMKEVNRDGTTTASITLSNAPKGLSGYELKVSVADPSVVTITDASIASSLQSFGQEPTVADDGSSVILKAVDLSQNIQSGATDIELATVSLNGQSQGETKIAVAVQAIDNDNGNTIPVQTTGAMLSVTTGASDIEPIEGTMPTNIDNDPAYEDLNGNGRLDFDDVVVHFQHIDDPVITDHVSAYDFNGNGEIDFDDVVSLFQEVH